MALSKRRALGRLAALVTLAALPAFSDDWNPRLAADYLDARQKQWFDWKVAQAPGGPCLSCHTGLTYLLARPALRRALGEDKPTAYETGLLDGLRARLAEKDPTKLFPIFPKEPLASQGMGVESIMAALFLTPEKAAGKTLSAEAQQAFDRMWSLQIQDEGGKGAWQWFSVKLEPWETTDSRFFGAALAALATGNAPSSYRDRPEVRQRLATLTGYLQREQQTQPLHNRLTLLWASTKLPEALPKPMRKVMIEEIWKKQQADGGWTIESLGPWTKELAAGAPAESNSYATSLVAFTLVRAGVERTDPRLTRALGWLKAHQDSKAGYWAAESMNKHHKPDSIPASFMRDAATAFASLALLENQNR